MDYAIYFILTTLMLYFAFFFYKTKNGVLRKGLIVFFIGYAISVALRPIMTFSGATDNSIAIHSPLPALVGVICLLVAMITIKNKQ